MLNNFISLHSYWLINIAIAVGYVISRLTLAIPVTKSLLQNQRLQLAKAVFILIISGFMAIPLIVEKLAYNPPGNFQIQPILIHASNVFIEKHNQALTNIVALQTISYGNIAKDLFLMFFALGFLYFLISYIKNILQLKKIINAAYCQHKIGSIHLLYTEATNVPFCWSTIANHFVIIPNLLLTKTTDLKLAVQHELQHIRQGDTHWSHVFAMFQILCFWNPFVKLWNNWLSELQEFACDEALVIRKNASPLSYGQCLVDAAARSSDLTTLPQGALGIVNLSKHHHLSLLHRRITMLFHYKNFKAKLGFLLAAYGICFALCITSAYALSSNSRYKLHTMPEINTLISQSMMENPLEIQVTPEVLTEINDISASDKARTYMLEALSRMKNYQKYIEQQLQEKNMPSDLLVLPLVESGYRPLTADKNPMQAAGIWQFIPSTATRFGLSINGNQDARLNTELETQAALDYLTVLHDRYNNWRLALVAYEIGELETDSLIKQVGSRDAWTLAKSTAAPVSLAKYLALLDAATIIMHNPDLITK